MLTSRPRRTVALAAGLACALALTGCVGEALPGPTAVPLRPTDAASFDTADLIDLMNQLRDTGVSAVTIEVRNDQEVWSYAVGVQSEENELPAHPGDPARVASLTKPIVSAITLQLVDEGKLSLDTLANDIIPGVTGSHDVTVQQLLQHTSGMPDYVPALALNDPTQIVDIIDHGRTNDELIDLALSRDWLFPPGEGWEYSNSNYIVLTMLIEELTGRRLSEELHTRITQPLGLTATSIPNGTAMPADSLHGYVVKSGLYVDVLKQDASLWAGAGGVVSTPADINTFWRALLTGQVVPPQLVGYMLQLNDDSYGLGVQSRGDSCPSGEATIISSQLVAPTLAQGEAPTNVPAAAPAPSASTWPKAPAEGSGSVRTDAFGNEGVQIGEPGMLYGHLGSGLGYRALTMSSPDGMRQVTVFWTASEVDFSDEERVHLAYDIIDAAISRECA